MLCFCSDRYGHTVPSAWLLIASQMCPAMAWSVCSAVLYVRDMARKLNILLSSKAIVRDIQNLLSSSWFLPLFRKYFFPGHGLYVYPEVVGWTGVVILHFPPWMNHFISSHVISSQLMMCSPWLVSSQYALSHFISSHCVLSHLNMSCLISSHYVLPHLIMSCLILMSWLIPSQYVLSNLISLCLISSQYVMSYLISLCLI